MGIKDYIHNTFIFSKSNNFYKMIFYLGIQSCKKIKKKYL
ncbi:hypothetical protein FDUTEX481_01929 [Tolypothrix sp. PCC 7601]|nr:hypothetical protein FDUTEX481_01929 [Tolypothrix sp. PCC 7601]